MYQRCNFRCDSGKRIDSVCTQDGTWEPYPTCPGDLRETQDGCDPCPGPFGGPRNRTLEGLHSRPKAEIAKRVKAQQAALETRFLGINSRNKQTRPSNAIDTGNRVVRPTFAGSLAFGEIPSSTFNPQPKTPQRSNVQSFIPKQTQRPRIPQSPTPPAPTPRQQVPAIRQPTSRPSSQPAPSSHSRTTVIEPKRTSPFISVSPDGRFRNRTPKESASGPAPSFQHQPSRQNQFSGGNFQQRNQNNFGQETRGRKPQSSFTPEQRKIIQSALSRLPQNVREGSNFFRQQGSMQQSQATQGKFANFPRQQTQMAPNTTPRGLDFNPLRSRRPQMQQLQPQSRPQSRPQPPPRPQPPQTQSQRQSNLPPLERQPRPKLQPQQSSNPRAPKKTLSALDKILGLQARKGPTGAKFGGTPPPPTERPKPQPVMLFQEDNPNPQTVQAGNNGNSFGVFEVLDLSAPTEKASSVPQLLAFPAIPNNERSSRGRGFNQRFEDNSQFGVFETVQL